MTSRDFSPVFPRGRNLYVDMPLPVDTRITFDFAPPVRPDERREAIRDVVRALYALFYAEPSADEQRELDRCPVTCRRRCCR